MHMVCISRAGLRRGAASNRRFFTRLVAPLRRAGEVLVVGRDDDVLAQGEVAHRDGALDHGGEGAGTAVLDEELGTTHGRGAVAASGAEAAADVGEQRPAAARRTSDLRGGTPARPL